MKLKTFEQYTQTDPDPCECGGNCGCGGKPVNEKFNFSKKEVEKAANLIASAISQADMVKAKVHDLEYDKGRGAGFEISIDGEKYEGGSYVVKDNGDVVNAAIGNSHPNAVYNTIGNKDIANVFINMEKYESVVTEAKDPYKEIEKAIKGMKGVSADIKGDTIIVSNKAGDEFTYSMNDADDVAEFIATIEESLVTEGMSKSAIKKAIKTIDKQIDTETGGDGEALDNETLQALEQERERLEGLLNEDTVTLEEAKKYKFKELAKAWQHVYGEDMEDEYQGFYQEVTGKYKDKVTKSDVATIWSSVYGEEVADEYGGFYNDLKENLEQVAKLEELDNLVEANTDGTISDDEDERREDLLGDVEMQIDELIQYGKDKAYEIGGTFRGPGIWSDVYKLIESKLKKAKR